MSQEPQTNDEWTIHSLNIHGIFFQRWCEDVIAHSNGWKHLHSEYPVEFPPASGTKRGDESALDIRAEFSLHSDDLLTLLIECKKNNPGFVNWIFFPKSQPLREESIRYTKIDLVGTTPGSDHWSSRTAQDTYGLQGFVMNEAREVRGTYEGYRRNDLTKTSNAAISDAARQVALATQAIITETRDWLKTMNSASPRLSKPFERQVYLPAIVTSARLFSCEFDVSSIDPATGEIPLDKANLREQRKLFYEYPLPRQLQSFPQNVSNEAPHQIIDKFGRMHILVVQSESLPEVLRELATTTSKLME